MKYIIYSLIALLTFDALAKVGYVEMVQVIQKTKQGRRVQNKLEKSLSKAKKSMATIDKKLKNERRSLEKELPLLSEAKRAQKIQQFQQKVMRSQQEAEAKQLELKKLEDQLMRPVIDRVRVVLSIIAKQEGFKVIHNLDKNVLWVSPESNLTEKVYTLFNKTYK